MHIFIDESGSFTPAERPGRWSVVGAHAVPEGGRRIVDQALVQLKTRLGTPQGQEIKMSGIDEASLMAFIEAIRPAKSLLFCVATDTGLDSFEDITTHRTGQVAKIRDSVKVMKFPAGKEGMERLAAAIEAVPNQLYLQLMCQVMLVHLLITHAVTYYAKRVPGTLSSFKWRIDQKNTSITAYEKAFLAIAPALLQTMAIQQPLINVTDPEYNYKKLEALTFPPGKFPDYLERDYGLQVKDGYDVKMILKADLQFVDSTTSAGVQVVDILTSATNRVLRGNFDDPLKVARAMGKLMIGRIDRRAPVKFVRFGPSDMDADQHSSDMATAMYSTAQSMI